MFGLLKRDDNRVYTAIVPNASKAKLQAVIRGRASLNSIVHTDGWTAYHGLQPPQQKLLQRTAKLLQKGPL